MDKVKQMTLFDCLVWECSYTIAPPNSLLTTVMSYSHIGYDQKEQGSSFHSPLGLTHNSAPSDYILTTLDNEIIKTVVRIGRPCTPDEVLLEMEGQDWGVKPRTICRHLERLGSKEVRVLTKIKRGVYTK